MVGRGRSEAKTGRDDQKKAGRGDETEMERGRVDAEAEKREGWETG